MFQYVHVISVFSKEAYANALYGKREMIGHIGDVMLALRRDIHILKLKIAFAVEELRRTSRVV